MFEEGEKKERGGKPEKKNLINFFRVDRHNKGMIGDGGILGCEMGLGKTLDGT
jgi:hypothetical protein